MPDVTKMYRLHYLKNDEWFIGAFNTAEERDAFIEAYGLTTFSTIDPTEV